MKIEEHKTCIRCGHFPGNHRGIDHGYFHDTCGCCKSWLRSVWRKLFN